MIIPYNKFGQKEAQSCDELSVIMSVGRNNTYLIMISIVRANGL